MRRFKFFSWVGVGAGGGARGPRPGGPLGAGGGGLAPRPGGALGPEGGAGIVDVLPPDTVWAADTIDISSDLSPGIFRGRHAYVVGRGAPVLIPGGAAGGYIPFIQAGGFSILGFGVLSTFFFYYFVWVSDSAALLLPPNILE